MYDATFEALEAAQTIAEFGCTVWIGADGDKSDDEVESVTAIVDEQIESIRRQMGSKFLEDASGRPVLFNVTPSDADRIPDGKLLFYQGETFTQKVRKGMSAGNIKVMVAILAISGGVG